MIEQIWKLARFYAVGLVCFVFALAVLAGLHELAGVNYLVAYVASFVLSNILGYLLNARFTFSLRSLDRFGVIRYMGVNVVMLSANSLGMKLLVGLGHMWYLWAAALLAIISAPFSFLGQRLFTYRLPAPERAAASLGR